MSGISFAAAMGLTNLTRLQCAQVNESFSPVPGSGPVIIVYPCGCRIFYYSLKNSVITTVEVYIVETARPAMPARFVAGMISADFSSRAIHRWELR